MGARDRRAGQPFRAFRTDLREAFAASAGPYVSIDVLLSWATTRFTAVPVRHDARERRASRSTLRQAGRRSR